jgi:hypothetical protein
LRDLLDFLIGHVERVQDDAGDEPENYRVRGCGG